MAMLEKVKILFAILALGFVFGSSAEADIAIIVNPNSAVTQVTATEVKRLYIGKTRVLENGTHLLPVYHEDGREIKQAFYDKVVQKPLSRIKVYWSRLVYSGRGRPPAVLGDGAKIKAWVASHEDAIGYIDREMLDESVRAVLFIEYMSGSVFAG